MTTDILFLTYNRKAFTEIALGCLIDNTDWNKVSRLYVHDDVSVDGAGDHVTHTLSQSDIPWMTLRGLQGRGPVASMNAYADVDRTADVFCKIDNDIAVPPGWLTEMLDVLERHPELELLGMEAGMTWLPGRDGREHEGPYGYRPASHIGGVGAIRKAALTSRPRIVPNGRFGWTEWQHTFKPVRGWIEPDLLVPCLDRIPIEPYASLSDEYVRRDWQRDWPRYTDWGTPYYSWLIEREAA